MDDNKRKVSHTDLACPDLTRRELVLALASGVALLQPTVSWGATTSSISSAESDAPLHYKSLSDVARLIEAGDLRPTELAQQLLDRIDTVDSSLHSYVTVMGEQAMASARQAEAEINSGRYRGPLHGMPIGIKDLCYTKGVRTMAGTKVLSDFIPDFDATVVAKLNAAGAVTLGKLALCEGAHGSYHPDLEVPVNPWDSTRWSGVSSSGSGVATAAGLCFGSVGTDTGGSIRYPSAVNGCVGLKPTYGRVSRHGVFALAGSMDHVGPMTRTVADAAVMYEAMAGFDSNDPTSLTGPVQPVGDELRRSVAGVRIGFDHDYASNNVEPAVAKAVSDVIAELQRQGAEIVDIKMPDVGNCGQVWYDLETAEAVIANAETFPSRADEYGPGYRAVLEYGLQVSGVTYARASKYRDEFSGRLHRMLSEVDCMVCPSMGNSAPAKLSDAAAIETDAIWESLVPNDIFTKPFNFSGVPTLSVPCGFSADGLPLSVQFVGARLSEALLCRVGHAYEQATEWHTRHPSV
jgi:amidase